MRRIYSESRVPVRVFLDLLNTLGRTGWHRAGPVEEQDFDLVPTISFHIHPDDADRVYYALMFGMRFYDGATLWVLKRNMNNRFFLCPQRLAEEGSKEGGIGLYTALNLRKQDPEVGRVANRDLISLADAIYEAINKHHL